MQYTNHRMQKAVLLSVRYRTWEWY